MQIHYKIYYEYTTKNAVKIQSNASVCNLPPYNFLLKKINGSSNLIFSYKGLKPAKDPIMMYISVKIFFCLQMPDVGSDELLHVNDKNHFFFAKHYKNLVHPCPKKMVKIVWFTQKSY